MEKLEILFPDKLGTVKVLGVSNPDGLRRMICTMNGMDKKIRSADAALIVQAVNSYAAHKALEEAAGNALLWLYKADIDGAFRNCELPKGGRLAADRLTDALKALQP